MLFLCLHRGPFVDTFVPILHAGDISSDHSLLREPIQLFMVTMSSCYETRKTHHVAGLISHDFKFLSDRTSLGMIHRGREGTHHPPLSQQSSFWQEPWLVMSQ